MRKQAARRNPRLTALLMALYVTLVAFGAAVPLLGAGDAQVPHAQEPSALELRGS